MKISKFYYFYKRVDQKVELHLEKKPLKPSYAFYNYIHNQKQIDKSIGFKKKVHHKKSTPTQMNKIKQKFKEIFLFESVNRCMD